MSSIDLPKILPPAWSIWGEGGGLSDAQVAQIYGPAYGVTPEWEGKSTADREQGRKSNRARYRLMQHLGEMLGNSRALFARWPNATTIRARQYGVVVQADDDSWIPIAHVGPKRAEYLTEDEARAAVTAAKGGEVKEAADLPSKPLGGWGGGGIVETLTPEPETVDKAVGWGLKGLLAAGAVRTVWSLASKVLPIPGPPI